MAPLGDQLCEIVDDNFDFHAEVISADVNLAADTKYNVIAVGDVANIAPLVVTSPDTPVPAGTLRVQVLHAAPDAPQVDVYMTIQMRVLS